jgi:hypothetical protein
LECHEFESHAPFIENMVAAASVEQSRGIFVTGHELQVKTLLRLEFGVLLISLATRAGVRGTWREEGGAPMFSMVFRPTAAAAPLITA